ncbi:MAG TPA: PilZ domain-containing protein [Polyangiaceae bacterium]|nr:PilZ domain-containing protein [Polyangiaceae bacterium]
MSIEERRAPGATRHPFDALVEVGGALGPTFEAQAVNVSEDGIQLRTAYLPEPGQPLTCRFDAGAGRSVLAAGEVAWAQGGDRGGEFGVRFTDVDAESVEALKHVCGVGRTPPQVSAGSKVRLHIDGLASPMRAKIKDARNAAVTVGSDLGFLQVGRQLELEDAQSGAKRPAAIDRVDVLVDSTSQVPQLVVTLRYCDVPQATPEVASRASSIPEEKSAASPSRGSMPLVEQTAQEMRGAFARSLDGVRPLAGRMLAQLKTTVAVLAKRRRDAAASTPRRTTAPPPGGALHATGRRIVRGESSPVQDEVPAIAHAKLTRRRAALAGSVVLAVAIGLLAIKKSHHAPPETSATSALAVNATSSASASASPAPAPSPIASSVPVASAAPVAVAPAAPDEEPDPGRTSHKKRIHVPPFGNGPVHHANVLRLKMDGPIESIEGAQQPTGFVVKLPGRKSLEAAAPLAARDSRIAAIKVSNDGAGAELTVAFRDGVPNYQVSARGDTLVIALAPAGALDRAVADKDEKGSRSAKHGKRSHPKADKTQQEL